MNTITKIRVIDIGFISILIALTIVLYIGIGIVALTCLLGIGMYIQCIIGERNDS